MQTYRDFRPTQFDCAGLGLEERQDWLVAPVLITRDTPEASFDASNYAVLLAEIEKVDPDGTHHEEHSFNHWGPGWFNIIIVCPGTECAKLCEKSEAALSDYPLLSDEDYSEREYDATCEEWDRMSTRERFDLIKRENARCSIPRYSGFLARRESPYDLPDTLLERVQLYARGG